MLTKFGLLAAGALGLCAMSFSLPAAAMMPNALTALGNMNVKSENIIEVARRDRRMRSDWEERRDGRRCSRREGHCRHFHDGFYYETPWWTLPLIVGGSLAANNYNDDYDDEDYGSSHVEWCLDHYRSYNPRTNTWVSYSGEVRECRSPY
jgi:hypothetical protein